jgi:hypothetical protein
MIMGRPSLSAASSGSVGNTRSVDGDWAFENDLELPAAGLQWFPCGRSRRGRSNWT